ncbi:hypothetical protein DYB30_004439 [Aphanomyces astaci]|uniref:glucan endo-1,3-beta-D-glucosidase n=1 Tax=Aphanomyces astaci TaxID=112090 RepID=A0A397C516_APHAT|nr:hypothetical protein DYB38_003880 [Aphanomyces astaci]RHY38884.1 hypothetical protein DYB30_004439 [Aphanomyces astaci]RHY57429.1 hypothetical protein DYB34_000013 [Aphanomyces astaci]
MPATLQPADLVISSLADKRYILHAAVARHDVSCVERLLLCYRRDLITSDLMACAARHGHLDLVQRFHLRGIPCSSKAMDLAATYGHLQVLTFLHVHAGEGCSDRAMVGAAEAGHLAIVQFLHTARPEQPTSFRAMDYAAQPSKIEEYFSADLTFGTVVPSISREVVAFDPLTVHLQYRNESNGTTFTVLLARGSPYVSINYTLNAPMITTTYFNILWCNNASISKTPTTVAGSTFTVVTQIEHQKTQEWLIFFPTNVTVSINSTSFAVQDETFSGIVRAAIVPRNSPDGTAAHLRQHASIVPVASAVSLSSNVTTGIMEFTWKTVATTTDSIAAASLLMLAHPHHVDSLVPSATRNRSSTTTVMHSSSSGDPFASSTPSILLGPFGHRTIKGNMSFVLGNSWLLADTFQEVGFNSRHPIAADAIAPLLVALKNDSNFTPQALDPYFFGKEIARQARLVLIADELNQGTTKLLDQLEDWLLPWFVGKNFDFFVYDTVWGGVCSVKGLRGVFWMTDFGNGWYNDHHFHYGYFIYAAAVVAKYRPDFVLRHRAALMSIVRDIANNSPHEYVSNMFDMCVSCSPYFPLARHMSWFDGHSFASGVYVLDGGKSQESVSEAINAYYGVYLLGQALSMPAVEHMGRHLMTLEMRAATTYWQTTVLILHDAIYGSVYAQNQMTGQIGSTKVTYATWFGPEVEHMHLINLMPFTPVTELFVSAAFVTREYPILAKALHRPAAPMDEIWKGYTYLDHAIVDAKAAWAEVATLKSFDDGNSRANSLYWIATRPTN